MAQSTFCNPVESSDLSSGIGDLCYMIMDEGESAGPGLVTACGIAMIHSAQVTRGIILIGPLLQSKSGLI